VSLQVVPRQGAVDARKITQPRLPTLLIFTDTRPSDGTWESPGLWTNFVALAASCAPDFWLCPKTLYLEAPRTANKHTSSHTVLVSVTICALATAPPGMSSKSTLAPLSRSVCFQHLINQVCQYN